IGCDNGERVRVAFALDCCDREAMSFLATTSGVSGEDVRDLMLAAVEHRFGSVTSEARNITSVWRRHRQLQGCGRQSLPPHRSKGIGPHTRFPRLWPSALPASDEQFRRCALHYSAPLSRHQSAPPPAVRILTRMLRGASSTARWRASASSAPLDEPTSE